MEDIRNGVRIFLGEGWGLRVACKQALYIGLFRDLLSNGARSKARGRAREGEPAMVLVPFEYLRSDSERKFSRPPVRRSKANLGITHSEYGEPVSRLA